MSNYSDDKSTDPRPDAGPGNQEASPQSNDPLVELARIVKQSKQPASEPRVDSAPQGDYFAGLDDLAVAAAPRGKRIEPSFATSPQPPAFDPVAAEPVAEFPAEASQTDHGGRFSGRHDVTNDQLGEPGDPVPAAQVEQGQVYTETRSVPGGHEVGADASPAKGLDRVDRAVELEFAPEAGEPGFQTRGQSDFAVNPQQAEPAADLPPSSSNLSDGFEDELIGALRLNVDQSDPADAGAAGAEFTGHSPEAIASKPDSETFGDYPGEPYPATSDEGSKAAPDPFGRIPVEEPRSPLPDLPDPGASLLPGKEVPSEDAAPPRPRIDENDLFAALGDLSPGLSVTADKSGGLQAGASEFDALFADLEFPKPADASGSIGSRARPESASDSVSAGSIDDMTWPAAAEAIPRTSEDEATPPPGGYDLDAVARAMQESDPTLSEIGVLPEHSRSEMEAAPAPERQSRKGLYAAAAVLAIAALGSGAFFFTDGSGVSVPDGPPPVIAGLQGPLKVFPEQTPAEEDNQSSKLIYDRVGEAVDNDRERLVVPNTPEPAELPPAPEESGGADLVPGAPRQVRTLIVRPDGTIISSNEVQDEPASGSVPSTPSPQAEPAAPVPAAPVQATPRVVATAPVTPPETGNAPSPVTSWTAPLRTETPAALETAVPNDGTDAPVTGVPAPGAGVPRPKPDVPTRIASAPPAATTPVATAPSRPAGPLDLTQSQPAQPQQPARTTPVATAPASTPTAAGAIPAGTWTVQLTSQTTESAAQSTYSSLQRRYQSILGSREAVIVPADLGSRGVWYRARLPMNSRNDAVTLCESLKAAGGDCFIGRN